LAALNVSMLFFFSSRRRHTRSKRDWSSDVCSSDLFLEMEGQPRQEIPTMLVLRHLGGVATVVGRAVSCQTGIRIGRHIACVSPRSEERRVGKECRARWGS